MQLYVCRLLDPQRSRERPLMKSTAKSFQGSSNSKQQQQQHYHHFLLSESGVPNFRVWWQQQQGKRIEMSRSSSSTQQCVRGGGSDSFSGRRKLFWGNDDHLKSFQLVQSYLWTLGRNYRGISLDEKDPKYSLENPASASWPLFFYV